MDGKIKEQLNGQTDRQRQCHRKIDRCMAIRHTVIDRWKDEGTVG
jgi:hypothetical protein